jgi:hypothetical protein
VSPSAVALVNVAVIRGYQKANIIAMIKASTMLHESKQRVESQGVHIRCLDAPTLDERLNAKTDLPSGKES